MSEIRQRLKSFRMEMLRRNLDACFISGTDPHGSEYLPEKWQTRQYISGFTGSYGVLIIAQEEAVLWTDSRYFIQAEEQLKGTGIKMFKLRVPDAVTPEIWLTKKLSAGSKVGFDSRWVSMDWFRNFTKSLDKKGINIVEIPDLFDKIWENRPALPHTPVFELNIQNAGLSRKEKRDVMITELLIQDADFQVITALDELAWLFNLRGSDIAYNPVFYGFGIIGKNDWILFTEPDKVPAALKRQLEKEKIKLMPYDSFFTWLKSMRGKKIFLDPFTASYAVWSSLQPENKIMEGISLAALLKVQKNETELQGFQKAMKKDGVALTEFLFWLRNNLGTDNITEFSAGKKLAEFRALQPDYIGESFAPIVGYREHGAVIHLSVNSGEALKLEPEGILLFDSGGQYLQGTTDVTRTIALGEVSAKMKSDFTLVLKGMITLTLANFPTGTRGCNIDVLARMALWQKGLNYGHGTGHGVGHFLNVHEGPVSVRQDLNEVALRPGMVLSNEPGLYREGKYGIRIENMMVCVEKEKTEFGQFLGFETLTLCPIDTSLIETALLSPEEKQWLNDYHLHVRKELKPLIREELADFLNELTREI
jgi:Xaa-Pro aminopeptidase